MKFPGKTSSFSKVLFVFITLLSISLLSACGGGGDDPAVKAVVDVNPIGFYQGTASVNDSSGTLMIDDLQAIVDVDTFIVVSVSNHLMYKGSISDTTISGASFTATVSVYKDAVYLYDATINGTVTETSKIKVTLSGTDDYTTGDVDLDYALYNNRTPKTLSDAKGWHNTEYADISFNTETNVDIILRDPINIWGGLC